jgi:hypothetical protein
VVEATHNPTADPWALLPLRVYPPWVKSVHRGLSIGPGGYWSAENRRRLEEKSEVKNESNRPF